MSLYSGTPFERPSVRDTNPSRKAIWRWKCMHIFFSFTLDKSTTPLERPHILWIRGGLSRGAALYSLYWLITQWGWGSRPAAALCCPGRFSTSVPLQTWTLSWHQTQWTLPQPLCNIPGSCFQIFLDLNYIHLHILQFKHNNFEYWYTIYI